MSHTGENDQGLRKIIDLTRFASLFILLLHFYYFCYGAFRIWGVSADITDRILISVKTSGLFTNLYVSKIFSFLLLIISLFGAQGRKDENLKWRTAIFFLSAGTFVFFCSNILLETNTSIESSALLYMSITTAGYLSILSGGSLLSRFIKIRITNDIFNSLNETFPQEERLLTNEYSINLPAQYNLKGKIRKSWINIINPFRGLLVTGNPGAGKSWFIIQHIIRQHLEKGFAMFVYDFKYDDLSRITYNWLQLNLHHYPVRPSFFVINFDNLSVSHRCNPLDPQSMNDITDATESARTILLGLNREWINKQGDFFVESPINFVTAIIWFLKKYNNGKFCTLPHVIELMQTSYDELFPVLNSQPEIEVLVNPFITAYQNDAMEQLEGQVASAKIGMARLASPQLYWVLSGNDFTLDINNPKHPKIVCVGNNPEKQQIYGAVLSLYISRLIRQVNRKGMLKCSLVFDEFPTIYFNNMDSLIATARSNRVATTLAMQDFSQLKKDYGKEQADVIVNITGNIISGQVMGDTSKVLSERFGKIMQDRQNISVNRTDTSISHSKQLDSAIPASKIASLSSGEFVGLVADNPDEKIKLKMFHSEILNDAKRLKAESDNFKEIPIIRTISQDQLLENYYQIKTEVKLLILREVEALKAAKN